MPAIDDVVVSPMLLPAASGERLPIARSSPDRRAAEIRHRDAAHAALGSNLSARSFY
jgi:hypothetical protein